MATELPGGRRSYARSSDWVLGHPGVGSYARAARGPPRVPLRGRNEMRHARLRIGACLSLSGKYAQFGRPALRGLEAWCSLDGTADLLAEDDRSDRRVLEAVLPGVAARCDLLLGPYSTQLMRAACSAPSRSIPAAVPRCSIRRYLCAGLKGSQYQSGRYAGRGRLPARHRGRCGRRGTGSSAPGRHLPRLASSE